MSVSLRTAGALAVALLAAGALRAQNNQGPRILYPPSPLLTSGVIQQAPINPNFQVAPGLTGRQLAYNMGVLGNAAAQIPPWMAGYNPYPPAIVNSGPLLANAGLAANPYALSTVGGFNPYLASTAAMSNSPYSLSTMGGGGYGGMGGYGAGMFGYGYTPNSVGYGYALMGIADYTRASGQYWKDIQQARMSREKVSQEQIETARRRIQFEAWYETMRPTAPKMRDAEMATDLDRARKDPPDSEIASGRVLNTLLKSIQNSGKLNKAASPSLEDDTLKHINLTGGTSSGNVGMLKSGGNLNWPEALETNTYDEARKRLTRNLKLAVDTIKDREPLPAALRRDIAGDYKTINDKLNESADDLSPSDYIESRRFLNQLNSAIKALSDPKVANYFNNTWNAKGKNVAELIDHMTKEGLTFAPATSGDDAAYKALYVALRNFEGGLQNAQR
jgi:hypothetical protein